MRPTLKINGKKLAEARQRVDLTQLSLAQKVGVREKSIQRIELGGTQAGINPSRVPKFAEALNMTREGFLSDIAVTGKVEMIAADRTSAAVQWLKRFAQRKDASAVIELLDPATIQRLRELLSLAPGGAHLSGGRITPPKAQQRRSS